MKDENIHIKVESELKNEIKLEAYKLGLTISAYLVFLHKQNLKK